MNETLLREEVDVSEQKWKAWKERGWEDDRRRERAARVVFGLLLGISALSLALIALGH